MKCGAASSGVILAPRLGEDGAEGLSSNGHVSIGQTAERTDLHRLRQVWRKGMHLYENCTGILSSSQECSRGPMKMKMDEDTVVWSSSSCIMRSGPAECSHGLGFVPTPHNLGPMDPRDLDHINDLLEGEAKLREVIGLSPCGVLSHSPDIHVLHRGSESRVGNLRSKHEQ